MANIISLPLVAVTSTLRKENMCQTEIAPGRYNVTTCTPHKWGKKQENTYYRMLVEKVGGGAFLNLTTFDLGSFEVQEGKKKSVNMVSDFLSGHDGSDIIFKEFEVKSCRKDNSKKDEELFTYYHRVKYDSLKKALETAKDTDDVEYKKIMKEIKESPVMEEHKDKYYRIITLKNGGMFK